MNKALDDVRKDAIKKLRESETENMASITDAADNLLQLWDIAKREGLLSLEEAIEKLVNYPMPEYGKLLTMLIVDGTDSELVLEIGTNEYWRKNPQGAESMVFYLYLRGILGIQSCEPSLILQILYQSLMPEKCQFLFQEKIKARNKKRNLDIAEKLSSLPPAFENIELIEKLHELESELESFDDRALQRILRNINNNALTLCLYGLKEETKERIFCNLNEELARMLKEDMAYLYGNAKESDILESAATMIKTIHNLCDSAEIVSGKEIC